MKRIAFTVDEIVSAIEGSEIVELNAEKTCVKKKGLMVLSAPRRPVV